MPNKPGPPRALPQPRLPLGIRDIAPESVLILAGGRAILLQLANPAVGHGVARHSDFVSRPLNRLNGTLAYVYAVTCGSPVDRARAVRRVALAHRPVHSPRARAGDGRSPGWPPEGTGRPSYDAFDPHLQLWVAATLYESASRMHDLVFGPLSDEDAETVYRDYGVLGTALQVPQDLWPKDRAAFNRYWQRARAELTTDSVTKGVARQLLNPPVAPLWLRMAMPLARLVTTGLLDPRERALFDLPWSPRRQRRFERLLTVVRVVYPRLPRRLRHGPMTHYLKRGREASPAGGDTAGQGSSTA